MSDLLTLNVIDGDYGLVSLDVECIQLILYAKIVKTDVEINVLNNLKSCALYNAPSLKTKNGSIDNFSTILDHFKKVIENIDDGLDAKQTSETLALKNLISMKLKPVLDFIMWIDQINCDDFISRWYMSALSFPFNYSYTKRKRNTALQLIEALYPLDTDLDVIRDYITKMATQCLSTLSTRLGTSKYFYGDHPASLDVIVYGYLAPLVKLPFPSNNIGSLFAMWPNLTEFVKRIDVKYFPNIKREVKYLQNEESVTQNDDDVSYAAIFILVVSASSLILGFVMKKGIFKPFTS